MRHRQRKQHVAAFPTGNIERTKPYLDKGIAGARANLRERASDPPIRHLFATGRYRRYLLWKEKGGME